MMQQRSTEQL